MMTMIWMSKYRNPLAEHRLEHFLFGFRAQSDVSNDFPEHASLPAGKRVRRPQLYEMLWWFVHRLAVCLRIDRLEKGDGEEFVRGLTPGKRHHGQIPNITRYGVSAMFLSEKVFTNNTFGKENHTKKVTNDWKDHQHSQTTMLFCFVIVCVQMINLSSNFMQKACDNCSCTFTALPISHHPC